MKFLRYERNATAQSPTRMTACAVLVAGALLAAAATKLPLLVFHLDTQTVPWTPASDGKYGVWALWAAATLNVTAAVLAWKQRSPLYLPILAAFLATVSTFQATLSGMGHVPAVGHHRLLVTDITEQWETLANSTHLKVHPGSGLALAAGAIVLSCTAAWFLHRESAKHPKKRTAKA